MGGFNVVAVIPVVIWLGILYAGVFYANAFGANRPLPLFGLLLGWWPGDEPSRQVLLLILIGRLGQLLFFILVLGTLWRGLWLEGLAALALFILGVAGLACRRRPRLVLSGLHGTSVLLRLRDGYLIFVGTVAAHGPLAGGSLAALDLRKHGLLVLAVGRNGVYTHFPKGQEILASGDRLIIYGRPDAGLSPLGLTFNP